MMTVDINDVAVVMSQLQTNYTNLALSWFDIFYNTTPQDISLDLYDIGGTLTTYTLPNRAKDFSYIKNGTGEPEGITVGSMGSIYQDLTNANLYIKYSGTGSTGWILLARKSDIDEVLVRGDGSPEGVLVGTLGGLYVDTLTGYLYTKSTSSGNTGWELVVDTKESIIEKLEYTPANEDTTTNITSGIVAPTSTPDKIGDMYVDTVLKYTYISNGNTSSSNWIKQNNGSYCVDCHVGGSADTTASTTYYWGSPAGASPMGTGTSNLRRYLPKEGTVKSVYGMFLSVAGSSEVSSLYVRINDTTDYLVDDAVELSAGIYYFSNTLLNIPINDGDYCVFKWVTPAWVTPPTTVTANSSILIDL